MIPSRTVSRLAAVAIALSVGGLVILMQNADGSGRVQPTAAAVANGASDWSPAG